MVSWANGMTQQFVDPGGEFLFPLFGIGDFQFHRQSVELGDGGGKRLGDGFEGRQTAIRGRTVRRGDIQSRNFNHQSQP